MLSLGDLTQCDDNRGRRPDGGVNAGTRQRAAAKKCLLENLAETMKNLAFQVLDYNSGMPCYVPRGLYASVHIGLPLISYIFQVPAQ